MANGAEVVVLAAVVDAAVVFTTVVVVATAAFVVVDGVDVFLDEHAASPGSKPDANPIIRQTPKIFNCFPFMILLPT